MLRMASLCTDCTRKLTQSSKAVQCQFCDRWTRARSVDISDELYSFLTRYSRSNLSYSYKDCLNKIKLLKGPREDSGYPTDRIMEDEEMLQIITLKLFNVEEKGTTVADAFRLGKKNVNSVTSPRPLNAVLESTEDVERILRRTY